jgi:hypothetical protein
MANFFAIPPRKPFHCHYRVLAKEVAFLSAETMRCLVLPAYEPCLTFLESGLAHQLGRRLILYDIVQRIVVAFGRGITIINQMLTLLQEALAHK